MLTKYSVDLRVFSSWTFVYKITKAFRLLLLIRYSNTQIVVTLRNYCRTLAVMRKMTRFVLNY